MPVLSIVRRTSRPATHLLALLAGALLLPQARAQPQPRAPAETATPCSPAHDARTPHLLVTVTGARNTAGNVTVTLYDDRPAAFLAHAGSIAIDRVPITGSTAEACFALSRPGTYAVAVYHDENDNHHFDRSWLGLPLEGYGFSNDAPVFMAPPSFASVRFAAGPLDTHIRIRLRY